MALKKMSFKAEFKAVGDKYGESVDWSEVGQFIEGIYKEKEEGVGKKKKNLYKLVNNEGKFAIWGTYQIDKVMKDIPFDKVVRITYRGMKEVKKSGNRVRMFAFLVSDVPDDFDIVKDIWDVSSNIEESETI
jgi:hypothetical protein